MPKQRFFTKDQLKDIKEQALLFWTQASNAHSSFFDNTNDRQRMAHALLPKDLEDKARERPDQSAIAPADFYINIQSLLAAINNVVFGSKPYGKVCLFGQPDLQNETTKKAEAVLQHMNDLADDEEILGPVIHQALYAGVSCCFSPWVHHRAKKVLRDQQNQIITQNGNPIFIPEEIASYAAALPIDIRRVRIDPSVDKLSDRKLVGHHYIGSLFELLAMNRNPGHWYDFDEQDLRKSSFSRQKYYEYMVGQSEKLSQMGMENQGFGDKIVEIKTIRGLFRIKSHDNYEFQDLIVDIANDTVLLGAKPNDLPIPGWEMYTFATVDSELGRFHPMGVLEPAEDMWMYLFLLMNNIIDRNNRDTLEMYLADKNAWASQEKYLQHEGGRVILVDTVASGIQDVRQACQPLYRPQQGQVGFELAAITQKIIQQIMKLNDYMQAGSPDRKETATAVSALVQGGQSLMIHLIRKLTNSLFRPLWRKKLILWNHFMGDKNYQLYTKGNHELKINPGEINAFWQIDIDTNAASDRPDMVRRVVESMPLLYQLSEIDRHALLDSYFQIINLPNRERILLPNDHLQAEVDRENIAMIGGVPMFVHPGDQHGFHIDHHTPFIDDPQVPGKVRQLFAAHIEEHKKAMAELNKGQLANATKDVGVGQLSSPALPAQGVR